MTNRFFSGFKNSSILMFTFVLLLQLLSVPSLSAAPLQDEASPAEYSAFLADKHGISIDKPLTKGEYIEYVAQIISTDTKNEDKAVFSDVKPEDPLYSAAAKLYGLGILKGPAVRGSEPLSGRVAVLMAVRASGLQELALTYSESKAAATLKALNIGPGSIGASIGQELAVAVDTGIVPSAYYDQLASGKIADPAFINLLLGKTLSFNGVYKQSIGTTADPDIYTKLYEAYRQSDIIQIPKLQHVVDTALKQDIVTGYNLKDARYDANFIESLSITYGHSDIKHAVQLIGLLRSEGLDARVQFEPKTSAFIYLKEWGEPEESELSKIVQIENGNYINYAKEYDLKFEFKDLQDKEKFQDIILQYAKKNEENQSGLIHGSWWQPLYYSLTELDDYKLIANNLIVDGHYYAQSFSLAEQADTIEDGFKSIDPSIEIGSYTFWVDEPFFNYLNGEYQ
ncbi:hypothetical protein AB6A23_08945 [Paenibacillus tarimensis]